MFSKANIKNWLLLISMMAASFEAMAQGGGVQCSATVGSFLGEWSKLIHNMLIIPPALGIIYTFLDGESTGWKEKIKSVITYGLLIWACVNEFMLDMFGWFQC